MEKAKAKLLFGASFEMIFHDFPSKKVMIDSFRATLEAASEESKS